MTDKTEFERGFAEAVRRLKIRFAFGCRAGSEWCLCCCARRETLAAFSAKHESGVVPTAVAMPTASLGQSRVTSPPDINGGHDPAPPHAGIRMTADELMRIDYAPPITLPVNPAAEARIEKLLAEKREATCGCTTCGGDGCDPGQPGLCPTCGGAPR